MPFSRILRHLAIPILVQNDLVVPKWYFPHKLKLIWDNRRLPPHAQTRIKKNIGNEIICEYCTGALEDYVFETIVKFFNFLTSDFIFGEIYIFIFQIFAVNPSIMILIYKTKVLSVDCSQALRHSWNFQITSNRCHWTFASEIQCRLILLHQEILIHSLCNWLLDWQAFNSFSKFV